MALAYNHRISKKTRWNIWNKPFTVESKKNRRGTSPRSGFASVRGRERQAAVKSGGIPEERVGKKHAPASGRDKRENKRDDIARKGRKKRDSRQISMLTTKPS
ncbi:Uncharacterized protein DBV15_00244 [Temnothorax longispinosus]|uniref:Uncharacterized protein n=1 Tax=Temnothorax longispinosus TaxID=300112 RepID=A0A4S2KD96_9HYME|nr:Uncharacterized protein DBV15_00244 [Temnothorax longispinosus]